MEKTKNSSIFNLSDLSSSWYNNAKRVAAWYIDTTESLAKEGLSLQEKSTSWAKDTPLAAFFEARNAMAQQFVENSAAFARSLFQIEKEEEEKARRTQA